MSNGLILYSGEPFAEYFFLIKVVVETLAEYFFMIKVASRASANMPFYIRMIGHGIANLPSTYLHPRDGIFANAHPSTLCVMTFACAVAYVLTHARLYGVPYRNAVLLSIARGCRR